MNIPLKQFANSIIIGLVTLVATGLPVQALEQGDWLVRGRIINVSPNDSSGLISGIAGTEAGVGDDTTLELDFTYMLSNNLGLELILGTTEHKVSGVKGVPGVDIGTVKLLPPTLTLQYHFAPNANIRPYAGVGINYTLFYDEAAGAFLAAGASTDYDDSWGLAAQAGVDIDIGDGWFSNIDLKYIDIDTTLTIAGSPGLNGTTEVAIDPWVFGIGFGKAF